MSSTRASRQVEKTSSVISDPKEWKDRMMNQVKNENKGEGNKRKLQYTGATGSIKSFKSIV